MKKTTILLLFFVFLFVCAFNFACSTKMLQIHPAKQIDRAYMVDLMDRYLEALVNQDPAGIPLASNVKLVENTEVTPIGEGLWKTATSRTTDYKIYVADPVAGQVGFMGLIEEKGKPIQLGVRLKLENGEITEIDHMIWRQINDPLPEGLIKPRPGLVQKLEESERVSREEMLKAANAYYDAIEQSDGNVAPFADECQRHEGGITSANNQEPLPEDAETTFGAMAAFGRMKCGEQLSTGIMGYITDINQRRLFAVDEEMGLVMAFSMFNHDGEPNPMPIKNGPAITESPNEWGQFSVGAGHIFKIRNGKIYEIEAMACVGIPYKASDGWSCTRKCLVDIMDQYLDALAKNDPSGVPLADDVMLVENTEKTPMGKGLWETATGGPADFRIYVADPDSGEVAFMGVIEENEKPTIAAIRLKVVDHKIKEIDHLVVHAGDEPLHPNMSKVRPALLERLPKLERVPNERMREIANSYYESIFQGNGDVAPFADECQRRENGGISVNDQTQTPEEIAKDDFSTFRKMKCGEQMNTGIWSYITDITDRRILAIDEEKGLAFAFSIFRHSGEPKVMKITGVPGVTELPNDWGAFDLPAAHIFKIRNGKIYEIEAIGYMADAGITNGWE
ncbi:MAG: hypothetical protein AMJ79_14495 [Phycisphaerae bacterium SM23_30]|nr:MAG: hypothetical protein AMJ79_14495 [Phycisphaerae bacterium SM23_30]